MTITFKVCERKTERERPRERRVQEIGTGVSYAGVPAAGREPGLVTLSFRFDEEAEWGRPYAHVVLDESDGRKLLRSLAAQLAALDSMRSRMDRGHQRSEPRGERTEEDDWRFYRSVLRAYFEADEDELETLLEEVIANVETRLKDRGVSKDALSAALGEESHPCEATRAADARDKPGWATRELEHALQREARHRSRQTCGICGGDPAARGHDTRCG